MKDNKGNALNSQNDLEFMDKAHLNDQFHDLGSTHIDAQLKVIKHMPTLFNPAEGATIGNYVYVDEIENFLNFFLKDKSCGPNGWTIELFLRVFDVRGTILLQMVEQYHLEGYITRDLSSNFISLIPKCNKPISFNMFRPISLCNLAYKLISKIKPNLIKPYLSKLISKGKFGFLVDRHILDVI